MSYDYNDMISVYLVVYKDKKAKDDIIAWSKDKELAKFYLKFHGCPKLELRHYKDYPRNINQLIINNHINAEIMLANLVTYDKNDKPKILVAPVTELEMTELHEFSGIFCDTLIDYRSIHKIIDYLKKKYYHGLEVILLPLITNFILFVGSKTFTHKDRSIYDYPIMEQIEIDELKMLYQLEQDLFGE